MSAEATRALIASYYQAFNDGDHDAFLALLSDQVEHDINQGGRETGVEKFRTFLKKMDAHYKETIKDIVIMVNRDGSRAAAEFMVHGEYLSTDDGLPQAAGQTYVLPAGAFFTVTDNKVSRISNYYNLTDWIEQVSR